MNTYAYVGSNPVNLTDPLGLFAPAAAPAGVAIAEGLVNTVGGLYIIYMGNQYGPETIDISSWPEASNDSSGLSENSCGSDDDNLCREMRKMLLKRNAEIEFNNLVAPGGRNTFLMIQWNEAAIQYNRTCVPLGHPPIESNWFFDVTPKGL